MKYKIDKNASILCHRWHDGHSIPEGFYKSRIADSLILEEAVLLHDPHLGNGGWTPLARRKSIAGQILGHYHPVWSDDKIGYKRFEHLEHNYYFFAHEIEEDVDFFLTHKDNVRVE